MKSSEVPRVAWQGLTTNKLRALLTMLGAGKKSEHGAV